VVVAGELLLLSRTMTTQAAAEPSADDSGEHRVTLPQVSPTHIVGVGASAGGLEALEAMFGAMPPDTGMAFVVQQHLSPDFESRMQELLARATRLRVVTVTEGTKLVADTVYLAPPNKEMMLSGDVLLLTERDARQVFTLPIDHFFRSLAQEAGARAIGVILSGTGSDGRRGVHAIHEQGGSVIAQTPESAKFDGMPKSAIATGVVDAIIDPEDIGAALLHHREQSEGARLSYVREPDPDEDGGLAAIVQLLRSEYGIDFAHYKLSTVLRRIERRLGMGSTDDLAAYAEHLRGNPTELSALYRDLLIGVTRFFRDPEAFEAIEREVIGGLLDKYGPDEEIRVWVAGCATGEEAYSLAILFDEAARARDRRITLKLFATDVHRASLEIASEGRYPEEALEGMRADRKARYFQAENGEYRVIKDIRQWVVFACHNVIADAPFTRVDLVTCRNLLIYFQLQAQKRALSLFHFALRTDGHLWLGPAETPSPLAEELDEVDRHWRIYRKRRDIRLTTALRTSAISPGRSPRELLRTHAMPTRTVPNARLLSSYDALLRIFMPASVLVDDALNVLHVFSGAERFLKVAEGRASAHLLDLLHPKLRSMVARCARVALNEGAEARSEAVSLELDGQRGEYRASVRPLRDARTKTVDLLVGIESAQLAAEGAANPPSVVAAPADGDLIARDDISALEAELRFTKENLQATIEELEASNEELQATNEELMAANEELQSTNEELHSVNEELYTVNVEHQQKIGELTELTDDMNNLLHATELGVLFLDEQLRIRKFTRRIVDTFRIVPQDVGRKIDDFAHNIRHPDLVADVNQVLRSGKPIEREVEELGGEPKFLRILPYKQDGRVTGVVITVITIGALKRAEARVRRLSAIVEHSHDAIMTTDLNGTICDWNHGAEALYGHSAEEAIGQNVSILLPEDSADGVAQMMERVREGQGVQSLDTVLRRRNGQNVDVSVSISPLCDPSGRVTGVSTNARDIRWRKRAEIRIRRAIEQRERFLAMLSHELRNPLMGLLTAAETMNDPATSPEVAQQAAQIVCRQSAHMAAMLDDLLDVSRMRQDRIEMRREPMDLRSTVDDVLDEVRGGASARDIAIAVQLPEHEVPVHGDRTRLRQLLANLLTNALKYSWDGQTVRIAMAIEGEEARLTVRDDGAGIDAETIAEIFEPFVQGEYQPAGGEGMGLGLALVRSIAAAHGGRVDARSAGQGRGAELSVWLPLDHSGANASKPSKRSSVPSAILRGLRVLVVEDQDDNRELLELGLQRHGMVVTGASNVSTARALLDGSSFDVGIIDIGLPDERGHEVARHVRQRRTQNMLLIALTGHGQQSERDSIIQAGFNHHVVKPCEIGKICQLISESYQRMRSRSDRAH
jgi:two-component system CheB/CheR fusion protein